MLKKNTFFFFVHQLDLFCRICYTSYVETVEFFKLIYCLLAVFEALVTFF